MAEFNGPLSKAPAREALIDLQFEPAVPIGAVNAFADVVRKRYEKASPIWQAFFGLAITPDGPSSSPATNSAIGVRLESSQPPHVLQIRNAGFTFSRLSPYGCWEDLRDAARAEWDEFIRISPSFIVNRIAVRYINELKIPLPITEFREYLTCPPDIPDELPQAVSSFLQRVVIPDSETDSVSIVTQALEDVTVPWSDSIVVLLDIDVFRHANLDSKNADAIWGALDVLRIQKNRMFFKHITDKMVEHFR